ncbi:MULTISPECIES: DNA-3-methyladenine glycosylase [unclassified Microbacterium]|uniref:DNA-3-methyladenine glycosylase family protein n=1 Tax=unclassified Microbacterium TaxID=2609290 RepID=UPI000EAA41E4|nr:MULTISPECIES: DNA-3-methyladenine glycosylase 2 family protein [unclassified Microbacterium]MBT2484871.1 DNA-3-methyladenine glycosylase 2 family protein [Microbacterium sp. ISL-108]RKN67739.1 DNA-3-methyladenine glycosylase 2 family protein [Microbacterium sp. CGR2]
MTLTAGPGAAEAAPTDAPLKTVYRPPHDLDLARTVGVLRRGGIDPTTVLDGSVIWRAVRTPLGAATLALRAIGGEVRVTAWGAGAAHALDVVPALCGADDDAADFDASKHPLIAESARRNPGLRLTRTGEVFDALACSILEQKVTAVQAFGAWRYLVSRFGERAPGPTPRPMFAPPAASVWRTIPSWSWHRAGVEPPQSKTIVRSAERGDRIEHAVRGAVDGPDRDRVLTSLPGVGVWTSAETRIRSLGDPDAVSVGDYHLAHEVGYVLTGSRTDDDGMLELLEPWVGQRQRVIRLIFASGVKEPRRGPRLAPENHRHR